MRLQMIAMLLFCLITAAAAVPPVLLPEQLPDQERAAMAVNAQYVVGKRDELQFKREMGVDKAGNAVVDVKLQHVCWIRICGLEGEPRWCVVSEAEYYKIKPGDRYYRKK